MTLRQQALLCLLAAAAVVLALHSPVLSFGLRYDDYFMLRPFGRADFVQVLTGNWGPIGSFQDAYYRPITSLYHAALFNVFGLHASWLHAVSLVELWLAACLIGVFVWRDGGPCAAVIAASIYLIHPVLPDSTSAWVLNQMHLLAVLVVLSALIVWQRLRDRPNSRTWWPIFVLAAIGLVIKEDTVMLLPAILVLQFLRALTVNDVPSLNWPLTLAAAAMALVLALVRWRFFPHFPVFDVQPPSWSAIAKIAVYAPLRSAALMFENSQVAVGASLFVLALQAAGAHRALRQAASRERWLWIQSAVMLAVFSLPLIFAIDIKSTRLHLTVLSASLMFAAGAAAILSWRPRAHRWLAAAAAGLIVAGAADLAMIQRREMIKRFTPCGVEDAWFDKDVRAWPVVNDDLKRWLDAKRRACSENRYVPFDDVVDVVRWTHGDGETLLVNRAAISVSMSLRADAAGSSAADVTVDGVRHRVALETTKTTTVEYVLSDDVRVWMRAAHRIDVANGVVADQPVARPSR